MMNTTQRKLFHACVYPIFIGVLLLVIHLYKEIFNNTFLIQLGIYPRTYSGLIGIITAPWIHDSWSHFFNNVSALVILLFILIYFYRPIHFKVIIMLYLVSGLWVWLFARPSYHIGASGFIYALSLFIFFSGIFRKDFKLMGLSSLVIMLYGSLFMGMLPLEYNSKISWESHLWGGVAGLFFAYWFKNEGPQAKKYDWSTDELYENLEADYNKSIEEYNLQTQNKVESEQPEKTTEQQPSSKNIIAHIKYIYKSK